MPGAFLVASIGFRLLLQFLGDLVQLVEARVSTMVEVVFSCSWREPIVRVRTRARPSPWDDLGPLHINSVPARTQALRSFRGARQQFVSAENAVSSVAVKDCPTKCSSS